ncbi:MAG: phenylacetic acid degradation operon negative regulatory protein [Parcubacteria group bacterium Licking1014_1]|nr:MAG: phenylacetic acid degradation operon negative regulatory protein [Parcubacteria group bacterium Licking1014_1]
MKPTTQKILLLLFTGVALSLSYTPRQYWRTLKSASKEWKIINKKDLRYGINKLYESKCVRKSKNKDGTVTIIITDKGKLKALTYHFERMAIEKKNWDGKWRIIGFDVPEKVRWGRDALRDKIKKLGFYELQKSVFIFPYNCKNEIDFIIEFFEIRKYVRFGILETIDNERHLKEIFKLT